ncbi:MAG: primosomal protein N', partial [Treponema sp.]|nr:primosomal protein N' [Treponema sp.]
AAGKGIIYLVPEIGLTPQVSKAVVNRFGDTAAILHSGLTPSQRLSEWRRILSRQARVVIGARSAVFAPVPDLGLIIIDEEHDGSYKSGSSPRYHARQVAMQRCRTLGIPLVMGSATPSVEAYRMMQEGMLIQHRLSKRLSGGSLPKIDCVNLSVEAAGDGGSISPRLEQAVKATLQAQKQAILFLNRRGFTNFFRCSSCGFELKCRNCSVTLTYHKTDNRLKCHYCGYSIEPPHQCPRCGSLDVGYIGFGTEFVENEVKAKFPGARIIRVDSDSLKSKDELQEHLDAFRRGDYDILLGTQVVAKGLNFPRLRLVGVILADSGLHMPDFRAAERTFALITQVAGRAGRFSRDGQVIVQSYSPDMPPVALAVRGDVDTFYQKELEQRQILSFPPYSRLLRLVFRSALPHEAQKAAEGAAQILRQELQAQGEPQQEAFELLGPSQCPLELIAGNWRWQIILRGKKMPPLQRAATSFIWGYAAPRHVYIEVDVDPVNML